MTVELLNWQRRRRRREIDTAAPTDEKTPYFWTLFLEGTELLASFDEVGALNFLERADRVAPADAAIRAALDETLGEAEFLLNQYGRALEHLRRAKTSWTALQQPLFEAEALSWLGACLVQQGRYQDGFDALESALSAFHQLHVSPRGARARHYVGVLHEELGDFPKAFVAFEEAWQQAELDGDIDMQGRALAGHGAALVRSGAPELALPLLARAVDALGSIGAHWHSSWCLLSIGRIHHQRGETALAIHFHETALEAAERGQSTRARVEVYAGYGELYSQLGHHEKGLRWLHHSLEMASSLGIRREIYQTHQLLSAAYKRAGQFEAALRHHEEFHHLRSLVFDELARERVATLKAEFELQRVLETRERERQKTQALTLAYEQLELQAETLTNLSLRDGLTGLFNRRHFENVLQFELQRAQSFKQPLSVSLLDIDFFKRINDTYGHLYGDEVLILMATIMRRSFRRADLLFRYGGEEFVAVLKTPTVEDTQMMLERFRQNMERYHFPQVGQVTASVGFTQILDSEMPSVVITRADKALYYAKEHGRNQTCCYETLIGDGRLVRPEGQFGDIELF